MSKKHLVAVLCVVLAVGAVWAEESLGSFGSFDEDTPVVSALTWNGKVEDFVRYYPCTGATTEFTPVSSDPTLAVGMSYAGEKVDVDAKIKVSKKIATEYPLDVLEELTLRGYLGDFVVEAGKMKVVWGKGDKLHVLDNFNATDYTDFIVPDYIDRRLALPMVRLAYNGLEKLRIEAVYTPFMVADRYATEGQWVPSSYTTLNALVSNIAMTNAQLLFNAGKEAQAVAYLSSISSDALLPDTNTLGYGQYGLRLTGTVNNFDWGVSYYAGREKQPSANLSKVSLSQLPTLEYDRLQVFGLEGAMVVGPCNFKGEFAYNLTDDVAGTDLWVHNNSLGWVIGFDVDIPIGNLNFNVQDIGSYLLGNDQVTNSSDVDYVANGDWCKNKMVFSLTDAFFHGKLATECNLVWGVEYGDLMVMPKLTYTLAEGLDVSLSGMYIHVTNQSSEFFAFKDNGYVQAKVGYSF